MKIKNCPITLVSSSHGCDWHTLAPIIDEYLIENTSAGRFKFPVIKSAWGGPRVDDYVVSEVISGIEKQDKIALQSGSTTRWQCYILMIGMRYYSNVSYWYCGRIVRNSMSFSQN